MSDQRNYFSFIDDFREQETLCNATIVSKEGASFRVHSAVLIACSNFFKTAFEFGPGEGGNRVERAVVRLPNVNADLLVVILWFTYLKEIELNCSNVWKILLAADFLQIDLLSQMCCDFMKKNLSLPTSVKLIEITQGDIFMPEVQRMATTFALNNLCKPSYRLRGQQKAALAQLRPETLRSLLQDDALNAPREQEVWQAVAEWLEAEPEQRVLHLDAILDTVRFGLMPKSFVSRNVLGHPVVQSKLEFVRQVQELDLAVDQVLSTEISEISKIPVVVQPRLPHTVVLSVGGRVNGAPSLEMQLYDINADAWTKVPMLESSDPEHTMAYHGLARLNDDLYVIGGTNSSRCLKLNLCTFKWKAITMLKKRRNLVSVVALNDCIYAIGGRSDPSHQCNFSAECYDPNTNQWRRIAPMHHRRSSAGCTVYGGKIYVVGGFNGAKVLSSSEVYNPEQNTWELLPDMMTPRCGLRCVTLGKHIYAIGGHSGSTSLTSLLLASVERFDPELRIWTPVAPMLTARSSFGATVVGDDILAVGGHNLQSVDTNEVYNVLENKWHSLSPLPSARCAFNMVSIEDSFDLAVRLLTPNRAIPNLIKTNRESHRPEFGTRLSPHAELNYGQLRSLPSEDECWQEDELGLAISANQTFFFEPVDMDEDESKEEPHTKRTRFY